MNALKFAVLLLIAGWSVAGHAADRPRTDQECARILEDWSKSPKSVPKRVADACKAQLATPAPATEVARAEPMAATDPCAGANAGDSVLCWGPWAALAPAAAPPITVMDIPNLPTECADGSEFSDKCTPKLTPQLVVEGCEAGLPCGFATVVAGVTSSAAPEDTTFAAFSLNQDGSQFTVAPGTDGQIVSVPGMATSITPRGDGYDQLNAGGVSGDQQSRLVARVVVDEDGNIIQAGDVWTDGNRSTRVAQSGYFAWGVATSQGSLNALNAGNVSVSFSGPMSVNNATNAAVTVNFGSQANWTGTWTNPAWSFGAGGSVSGVNLVSNASQFTSNVVADSSFVQGVLLGEQGQQALAHIINVTVTGQGGSQTLIKDVGLLRQVAVPVTPVGATAGP